MKLQGKKEVSKTINLIPREYRLLNLMKKLQKVVLAAASAAVLAIAVFAGYGYITGFQLDKEIKESKAFIASARLDELDSLKQQYDNLLLGIDSGNISLVPVVNMQLTDLLNTIDKHRPGQARLTGMEGTLKTSGEYTYRLEYSSSSRTVIAGFLEALQKETMEYINISSITKSAEEKEGGAEDWKFYVTVKLKGGTIDE